MYIHPENAVSSIPICTETGMYIIVNLSTYSPRYRFSKAKHLQYAGKADAVFFPDSKGLEGYSWQMYQIDIIGMDDEFGKRDPEKNTSCRLWRSIRKTLWLQ